VYGEHGNHFLVTSVNEELEYELTPVHGEHGIHFLVTFVNEELEYELTPVHDEHGIHYSNHYIACYLVVTAGE
jgi:hypothetical protein